MQEVASEVSSPAPIKEKAAPEVVSTHVLVPETQVERLRQLARKTRIAQSEYLREAVDNLLSKYGKAAE
ncbi:MAG TPA: ribbon-helix-helix domain-containing protein [Myxococcaceae bacterium]|nr:ribbon-helix-helix domain-containing protein [Myxococcaceae bacterium]